MSAQLEVAALRLLSAGHGERGQVAASIADEMGCSVQTVYSRLKPLMPGRARKKRADAGASALTRPEAMKIAAYVEASRRQTGTGAATLGEAVRVLRANGSILAGRVDEATGEFHPLSESQVRRQLRLHNVHPEQISAATPAARLSSPHPNWCWQIDASVSRQFYLADSGSEVMDRRRFYRGKPKNFEAIAQQRIWRYVVTDHCSGAIEVFYVQGAESTSNFLAAFIHAMTQRAEGTMHGVPRFLMSDPGSAVTAAPTRNLCAALDVELIVNEAGNARAKGQVENANYLTEVHFESGLKFEAPVISIAEINGKAQQWSRWYNATRVHSRHGMTRRDAWLRITSDQLRLAPSVAELRQLANTTPKTCTVRDWMIRFGGRVYDMREMPGGALNGQQVQVVRNALDSDQSTVRVLCQSTDGRAQHFLAPLIERQAFGFLASAAEIGTEHKAPPQTAADAARKELDRLAMQVTTDEDAKAARKAKRVPFGGTLDPRKHQREAEVPQQLPRAGRVTRIDAPATVEPVALAQIRPAFEAPLLGHVEIARRLRDRIPGWGAGHFTALTQRWPRGAREDALDDICRALSATGLRAVP